MLHFIGSRREGSAYAAAMVLVGGLFGYMVVGDFGLRPSMPAIHSSPSGSVDVAGVPTLRPEPSSEPQRGSGRAVAGPRTAPRAERESRPLALPELPAADGPPPATASPSPVVGPPHPLTCPERGPAALLHPLLKAWRKVSDAVGVGPAKPEQAACGQPQTAAKRR